MKTRILTALACLFLASAAYAADRLPGLPSKCTPTKTTNCTVTTGPTGNVSVGNPSPATTPPAGSLNILGNFYKNGVLFTGGSGTFDPTAPGTIGGTTPGIGHFTSLDASSFSIISDGVHAGLDTVLGNTTPPALPANSFSIIGPNSAAFTSYALQPPATAPTNGQVMVMGTPVLGVVPVTFATIPATVASGATAMATASIAANTCTTVVTATATGALTTDVISFTPNASIKAVTGYTPAGTLTIVAYPTAGNVNFDVCNKDQSNAVVPGAVTLNWKVIR